MNSFAAKIFGLTASACALALAPGVAHAEPFSGEYIGVQAGVVVLDEKLSRLSGPSTDSSTEPTASLVFGYRTPISDRSPIVLGIEGDLGAISDNINARFAVSGIAGYRIGDSALAYGRLGYAAVNDIAPNSGTDGALSFGGGVEFNLTGKLNLRADYRYEDFGKVVNFVDNVREVKAHEVTAGLLYTF